MAWVGLTLLAIPIVIHLLARQRSRRVLFPSLRFVPTSQLAALRTRRVARWPLLVVRLLIVAVTVAAAAAPVWVSAGRQRDWNARVARAVIVTGDSVEVETSATEATTGAFTAEVFPAASSSIPDAVRQAIRWLRTQPPAAREIVIVGDVREGSLSESDLGLIDPAVGLRFLPVVPTNEPVTRQLAGIAETTSRQTGPYRAELTPARSETTVRYVPDERVTTPGIRVIAASAEQAHADAVLRAVLREGLLVSTTAERAVTVVFAGGTVDSLPQAAQRPDAHNADREGWRRLVLEQHPDVEEVGFGPGLVLRAAMPVTDPRAPGLLARVLRTVYAEPFDRWEPRRVPAATLAAWSRPSSGSPPDVMPQREGDHRWLWVVALLLLGVEQLLRGKPRHA
jgi:hypothetical protein